MCERESSRYVIERERDRQIGRERKRERETMRHNDINEKQKMDENFSLSILAHTTHSRQVMVVLKPIKLTIDSRPSSHGCVFGNLQKEFGE